MRRSVAGPDLRQHLLDPGARPFAEVPALDQFDTDSDALGLGLQWLRPSRGRSRGRTCSTAGGEGRTSRATDLEDFRLVDRRPRRLRRAGGDQQLFGLFLQDTISFHDRWQLQIGARGDRWEASQRACGWRASIATGVVSATERPPAIVSETELGARARDVVEAANEVADARRRSIGFPRSAINELYRPVSGA